ncbi:hypothetical protein MRX96_030431 [Rhipicephalus microplus]
MAVVRPMLRSSSYIVVDRVSRRSVAAIAVSTKVHVVHCKGRETVVGNGCDEAEAILGGEEPSILALSEAGRSTQMGAAAVC